MTEATDRGERLDCNDAEMHSKRASGFVLVVGGVAPVPMSVELSALPVGVVPKDYNAIEVTREDPGLDVETPWRAIDTDGLAVRRGVVLITRLSASTSRPSETPEPIGRRPAALAGAPAAPRNRTADAMKAAPLHAPGQPEAPRQHAL